MKKPRMTVRRLMIAVAVVAIGLSCIAAVRARRRAEVAARYSRYAGHCHDLEQRWERVVRKGDGQAEALRRRLAAIEGDPTKARDASSMRAILEDAAMRRKAISRVIDHYATMGDKYSRAATQPWEPLPPDPTCPPLPPGRGSF